MSTEHVSWKMCPEYNMSAGRCVQSKICHLGDVDRVQYEMCTEDTISAGRCVQSTISQLG
jgi:hypothetical protein